MQAKIPNLSKCQDISEFLTKPVASESEAEDDETSHVKLSQKLSSRGNHANSTSAIKLFELGPRITLQVIKLIEANMLINLYKCILMLAKHILVNQSRKRAS